MFKEELKAAAQAFLSSYVIPHCDCMDEFSDYSDVRARNANRFSLAMSLPLNTDIVRLHELATKIVAA